MFGVHEERGLLGTQPHFLKIAYYYKAILDLQSQQLITKWINKKKIENHLEFPSSSIMPMPNINFVIILDVVNTTLLGFNTIFIP